LDGDQRQGPLRNEAAGIRRCYSPNPYFVAHIMFLYFFMSIGPTAIYQKKAKDLYGGSAEFYYNAAQASQGICATFASPLLGALSDRWGRKPIMFFCAFGYGIAPTCLYFFDLGTNSQRYLIFLILFGTVSGLTGSVGANAIYQAYIADTTTSETRSQYMGRVTGLGATGWILGPLFWSKMDDQFGYHNFLAIYLCVIVVQLVSILIIPESVIIKKHAPLELAALNPLRYLRILRGGFACGRMSDGRTTTSVLRNLFAVILALYTAKGGFVYSLGLYAQERYNFSTDASSLLQTTYGVFSVLGQVAIPFILTRLSKRNSIAFGVSTGCIAGAITAIPGAPGWVLFITEGFLAIGYVAFTVCCAVASEVCPPEAAGEATAVMNIGLAITGALGPIVFGILVKSFLHTAYPGGAFLIFTAIMMVGVGLAVRLPNDHQLADRRADLKRQAEEAACEEADSHM